MLPVSQLMDTIESALLEQLPIQKRNWLKPALSRVRLPDASKAMNETLMINAMLKRMLGAEVFKCVNCQLTMPLNLAEAARILCVARFLQHCHSNDKAALVRTIYQTSDTYERIAIIKGLILFAELVEQRHALVALAKHAGRENSVDLFAALALHNPFAMMYYDDQVFYQLVLKALFMDLNLEQMVGLPERLAPNLSVLCFDLVTERLLANREPPYSIWLAMQFNHLSKAQQACYLSFSRHEDAKQRYYSLLALMRNSVAGSAAECPPEFYQQLSQAKEQENNPQVKAVMQQLLQFYD